MDYKRFKNVLLWQAANGYKTTVRAAGGLFFAFLLIYCIKLGFDINFYMGETWEQYRLESAWLATGMALTTMLIFVMSAVTSDMRSNDGRVMSIMLPASNAEKFWARIVWIVLSYFAAFVVAVVCADIVRVLISYMAKWPIHSSMLLSVITGDISIFSIFPDIWNDMQNAPVTAKIELILLPLASQAVFLLGGTFFRRQPLLFTLLTSFVISTIFSIIITTIFGMFAHRPDLYLELAAVCERIFNNVNHDVIGLIFNILTVTFIVLHYWAAYKLFCRTQVISNKWINI